MPERKVLIRHAAVHLGNKISTYFEDENESGIVLETGTKVGARVVNCPLASPWKVDDELRTPKISADIVIAADGVRSKARKTVLGYEDKPKSSGYAVWRAW